MFDKKSEYALNKHDQDSIIYSRPAAMTGDTMIQLFIM